MQIKFKPRHATLVASAVAAMFAALHGAAQAQEKEQTLESDAPAVTETKPDPTAVFVDRVNKATGLEFWGYGRAGFYGASRGVQQGGYTLGGDMQKYRLGNEGDNYIEFGIGKRYDMGSGISAGAYYMPKVYNGNTGTAQLYFTLGGILGNEAYLWAGQRYHRIQDVHIVDRFFMEDGDNYGAGIDDIPLAGLGRVNFSVHSSDSFDNKGVNPNNARRANLQWRDIPTNPDGKLTVTAGLVSGSFTQGKDGGALGVMHVQKNFLVSGLNNSAVLQASTGHASISGKFYNLDTTTSTTGLLNGAGGLPGTLAPLVTQTVVTPQPGAQQRRVLDSLDFQIGRFGGQTLAAYQTTNPDSGAEVKDLSLGGRVSYGIGRYTKLLAELGVTRRAVDRQARQTLNKGTLAVAFSPNTDFWTRPEFRLYATRANWNQAAAVANASTFGANGRTNATIFGAQMEVWWK